MKTSLRPTATPSPQRLPRPRVGDRPYRKTRPSGQRPRRQFLRLAVGAAALPAVSCDPEAQSYPSRPITMIVPFSAGGITDALGRVMVERMRGLIGLKTSAGQTAASASAAQLSRGPTATRLSLVICPRMY